MKRIFLYFAIAGVLISPAVHAACTSPPGSDESFEWDEATHTWTYCDGTTWKNLREVDDSGSGVRTRIQIANDTGSCTAAKLGRLRYDGTSTWEYCDGTTWQALASGGSTSAAGNTGEIQFNSGGVLGASSSFVFTSAGRMGIGTNAPTAPLSVGIPNSRQRVIAFNDSADAEQFYIDVRPNWQREFHIGATYGGDFLSYDESRNLRLEAAGDQVLIKSDETIIASLVSAVSLATAASLTLHNGPGGTDIAQIRAYHLTGVEHLVLNTLSGPDDQMVLHETGNVGIGVDAPATLLDVAGAVKVDYDATACAVGIQGAIRFDSAGDALHYCDGTTWQALASGGSTSAAGNTGEIQFNSGGVMGASSNYFWDNTNSRLGLGTNTPGAPLEIEGNGNTSFIILDDTEGVDADNVGIRNNGRYFIIRDESSNVDLLAIGLVGASQGRVGIGTTSPESWLHVPDGKYFQAEDSNAGAPPAADCDTDAERGRQSIDTTNNLLYICNGATRGWDYVALSD